MSHHMTHHMSHDTSHDVTWCHMICHMTHHVMSHDMSHAATFSSCGSGVMWRTFLRSSRIRSMTMMSSSSRSSHSCEGVRKEWVRVWCDGWGSEGVRMWGLECMWVRSEEFAATVSLPSGTTQRAQSPGHAPHSPLWTPLRDTQSMVMSINGH